MQATRVSTTLLLGLLGLLGLSACDSELDEENFDEEELEFAESDPSLTPVSAELEQLDGPPPLEPDELPADEIEAPSPEQQTVSCDLGLPTNITANWYNMKTATGVLSGLGSGFYTLELSRDQSQILNLHYWQAWIDGVWVGGNAGIEGSVGPFSAGPGDVFDLELRAPTGAYPGWSYTIDLEFYSYPNQQLICSDTITMTIPTGCIGVAWWYQNPFPTPWDDGANCMVATLPPGATGFMYQGAWYVTPINGNQCSIGSFDGANCYIGIAPMNRTGFIWQQKLYYNRN